MGWLVLTIIPAIISQTTPIFWSLMVTGGLSYTVELDLRQEKTYFHMIWHLFILAASAQSNTRVAPHRVYYRIS